MSVKVRFRINKIRFTTVHRSTREEVLIRSTKAETVVLGRCQWQFVLQHWVWEYWVLIFTDITGTDHVSYRDVLLAWKMYFIAFHEDAHSDIWLSQCFFMVKFHICLWNSLMWLLAWMFPLLYFVLHRMQCMHTKGLHLLLACISKSIRTYSPPGGGGGEGGKRRGRDEGRFNHKHKLVLRY